MESQQNLNKKQKKNQNKNKKRLMSLFRGPKLDYKWFCKLTEEESKDFKQTITDIIIRNPFLKLHQKKKNVSEKESESKDLKITDYLVLGLNSIIRSIEKKSVIGVILSNPLALPLEDNIIEFCSKNQIPCLSVHLFDEIKSCLNISSLSGIAFKPNVISSESFLQEFYEKFKDFFKEICFAIDLKDPKSREEDKEKEVNYVKKCEKVKPSEKIDKSQQNITKYSPLFELLYSKNSEDNYRHLIEKYLQNRNQSNVIKDEFVSQQSIIKFSQKPELYFPETKVINKRFDDIKIILDEQNNSNDDSFAQSLIESMDEREDKPLKSFKRKFDKPNERHETKFKSPRMVRVEPKQHIIRQKKKQMKKLKSSSKKS